MKIIIVESGSLETLIEALKGVTPQVVATLQPDGPHADDMPPDMAMILAETCKRFRISPSHIHSKSREANVSMARHVFFYLCRSWSPFSLSFIGKRVGMDHTSVMNGVDRIRGLVASKAFPAGIVKAIEIKLRAKDMKPNPERTPRK